MLENTIEAMVKARRQPERVAASLGPSISQDNYEVGPEYVARFVDIDPALPLISPDGKTGTRALRSQAIHVDRLTKAGVMGRISAIAPIQTKSGSTPTAAPPTAPNPITDGRFLQLQFWRT